MSPRFHFALALAYVAELCAKHKVNYFTIIFTADFAKNVKENLNYEMTEADFQFLRNVA